MMGIAPTQHYTRIRNYSLGQFYSISTPNRPARLYDIQSISNIFRLIVKFTGVRKIQLSVVVLWSVRGG